MQGQSIIKHVSEIRIIEIPLDSLDRDFYRSTVTN